VDLQEHKKYIESLQLLHDNRMNIEEAKKISSQLEEATELEESTYYLCII
jgi:ribosomal protein L7/L12